MRSVPYQERYQTLDNFSKVADGCLWLSVVLAIGNLLLAKNVIPVDHPQLAATINNTMIVLSITYFSIDLIVNYLFQAAETERRKDLLDHSLNTNLAHKNSSGYFTNHEISSGFYKLGVNTFESSYFTRAITAQMLWPAGVKTALVLLVFVALALWGDNETLTTVLQMALPFTIIQQFIRLLYFQHRIDRICENFNTIFQLQASDGKNSLLLHAAMTYDSTLAWAAIKIDDKPHSNMNARLSAEWANLKTRLNIR